MAEKDDLPMQGDLLKALDDLTDLITEQEQRGRVWSVDEEDDEIDIEGFEFDPADDDPVPLLTDVALAPEPALPSPAEIEAIVERVLDRRMTELRAQVAREIMIELRKRHPEL